MPEDGRDRSCLIDAMALAAGFCFSGAFVALCVAASRPSFHTAVQLQEHARRGYGIGYALFSLGIVLCCGLWRMHEADWKVPGEE